MAAKKKAAPEATTATKAPRKKKQATSSAPGEGGKAHEWLMQALEANERDEEELLNGSDEPQVVAQPEVSAEKQRPAHLFKPGQSGNPKGRPKGSRSKFAEEFISDFLADWKEGGLAAITKVRTEQPGAYLRVAAMILPKQMDVRVSEFSELTEDSLDQRIEQLAKEMGVAMAILQPKANGVAH